MIENEIDKGMYDILIELNRKNYKTIFCCEGHLTDHDKYGKDYWNGYIAFADTYNFPQFPKNFYKVSHKRMYFYWHGNGEESRQKYLSDLYDVGFCFDLSSGICSIRLLQKSYALHWNDSFHRSLFPCILTFYLQRIKYQGVFKNATERKFIY